MKKLIILCVLLLVLFAGGYFWWQNGMAAVNPQDRSQKLVVIAKGEGIREIGYALRQKGLIRDPIVFFILVKKMGLEGKIQAGDFRLSPSMRTEEIAQNLTHGTLDIWITVPEGKRASEIAQILQQNDPDYDVSWKGKLDTEEGYLFPDTYLIPKDAGIATIISIMKKNFQTKFASIQKASASAVSDQQIVIVASIIEREAKFEQDRPLVASVIYNRLKETMPLQIDATVQYALGYSILEKTWWKKKLTAEDLKINSPYNTYVNTGLPPTPICNPGLSALTAATNPADTNFRYYISDAQGHLHFAKTNEEQNENIKKYGL